MEKPRNDPTPPPFSFRIPRDSGRRFRRSSEQPLPASPRMAAVGVLDLVRQVPFGSTGNHTCLHDVAPHYVVMSLTFRARQTGFEHQRGHCSPTPCHAPVTATSTLSSHGASSSKIVLTLLHSRLCLRRYDKCDLGILGISLKYRVSAT